MIHKGVETTTDAVHSCIRACSSAVYAQVELTRCRLLSPRAAVCQTCVGCDRCRLLTHGRKCRECHTYDANAGRVRHPPLPPSPPPSPSPPPTLFSRPLGCLDPLSPELRAAVVTLAAEGHGRNEIASMLPCSRPTVTQWTHRWRDERSLQDAERSGRPRCTDDATDEAIADFAEEKKFVTPKQIAAELALPVSDDTVRRRLDEAGLHGRVARAAPMWTPTHIRKRISFAGGYARWTEADWERVIFSDETHVELSPTGQIWVQRPVGAEYDPQYVIPRRLHSERVTLWGCFCAREIGQAEIFVGEFDASKYVDVLQHNLLPAARSFFPSGQWWFQQDNAPQHTSRAAQRWFHNNGVDCIDFPPLSPDLNPIENMWADLKRRVEQRRARTMEELEQHLKEEWEATSPTLLASLAHSMPARLAAVRANEGHYAGY